MKVLRGSVMTLIVTVAILMNSCGGENGKIGNVLGGEQVDTLFLGMYFNMPSKDFYQRCWTLNKEGILFDGSGNSKVKYILKHELTTPGTLQFYPSFEDDKIANMTGFIAYDGWAPWNKHLSSEILIEEVRELFIDWYDIDFKPTKPPTYFGKAYVGRRANLEINLFYDNDNRVNFLMKNLNNTSTK